MAGREEPVCCDVDPPDMEISYVELSTVLQGRDTLTDPMARFEFRHLCTGRHDPCHRILQSTHISQLQTPVQECHQEHGHARQRSLENGRKGYRPGWKWADLCIPIAR